jgi:hypothetical protein
MYNKAKEYKMDNYTLKLKVLEYLSGINQPFKYHTIMAALLEQLPELKVNTSYVIARDCHEYIEQGKDCIVRLPNTDRILVIPNKAIQPEKGIVPYVCFGISHDYLEDLPDKSTTEIDVFATDADTYSPVMVLNKDSENKLNLHQDFTPLIAFGFKPSKGFMKSLASHAKN